MMAQVRILLLACLAPALAAQAPIRSAGPQQALSLIRPQGGLSTAHRACASCHTSHHEARGGMVARSMKAARPGGDALCLACHAAPPSTQIAEGAPRLPTWEGQGSGHGQARIPAQRGESFSRIVRGNGKTVHLVEGCSGCHDPHGKERGRLRTTGFDAQGQLLSRRPVSVAEVCFGCHAGPEATRLPSGSNPDLGIPFAKGAQSSHGIGATAASRPDLPSLRATPFRGPLDCTSCHDNPDPAGPRGPHASPHVALLKAAYGQEKDLGRLGERVNDLCYGCHDRHSIAANQSFPFHAQHLEGFTNNPSRPDQRQGSGFFRATLALGLRSPRDLRPGRSGAYLPGYGEPTPCATCHAAHGAPRSPSLIEFDRSVVSASSLGGILFQRSGLGHGSCTLSCHGYDHVQTRY